jgi:hypothetical protein
MGIPCALAHIILSNVIGLAIAALQIIQHGLHRLTHHVIAKGKFPKPEQLKDFLMVKITEDLTDIVFIVRCPICQLVPLNGGESQGFPALDTR